MAITPRFVCDNGDPSYDDTDPSFNDPYVGLCVLCDDIVLSDNPDDVSLDGEALCHPCRVQFMRESAAR